MRKNSLIAFLFFGNYFYGICAVALSMETALVLNFPLQDFFYYLFIFATTTFFYTIAYLSEPINQHNPRTIWYVEHKKLVRYTQCFLFLMVVFLLLIYLFSHFKKIIFLEWEAILLMALFPFVAMAYYGANSTFFSTKNIRQIGWLKPCVIGFVWAGTTIIYPFFYEKINNPTFFCEQSSVFNLFLENTMFITVLGIMFDIKDYAADSNEKIKTFVVQHGLRKTIFHIIFPLTFIGWALRFRHFFDSPIAVSKVFLQAIPYLLLLTMAYSLRQRKSILYYLILVDGLILIKVFCTWLEKII